MIVCTVSVNNTLQCIDTISITSALLCPPLNMTLGLAKTNIDQCECKLDKNYNTLLKIK